MRPLVLALLAAGCNTILGIDDPPASPDAATTANASLVFRDADLRAGFLGGELFVTRAADESTLVEYQIFLGSSATAKLVANPLATLPAAGVDLEADLASDTPLPADATHLLTFAIAAGGAESLHHALPLVDNTLAIDTVGERVASPSLVFTPTGAVYAGIDPEFKLRTHSCNAELALCTSNVGELPLPPTTVTLHATATGIVVVTNQYDSNTALSNLVVSGCNLTGTECTIRFTGGELASATSSVLDGDRLFIATTTANSKLGLYVCNADGTDCVFRDASAGANNFTGLNPSLAVDRERGQLHVITNDSNGYLLHLFQCNLAGTSCTVSDASAGQPDDSGDFPAAVFDPTDGQMLAVSRYTTDLIKKPALFRCDVSSTACTYHDASAGQPNGSNAGRASLALFPAARALFFVTYDEAQFRLSLFRCRTDGTECTHRFLSEVDGYDMNHDIVIDPTTETITVLARERQQMKVYRMRAW